MSKPVSVPNAFQTLNGPIPLAQLDADFTALASALNDVATYGTLLIDSSGVANTITVTTPVNVTFSYSVGVLFQVQIANTNTSTAVTINVNALGAKALVNADGTLPQVGQFVAAQMVEVQYDGVAFRALGSLGSTVVVAYKQLTLGPTAGSNSALTAIGTFAANVPISVTGAINTSLQLNVANTGGGTASTAGLDLQDGATTGGLSYSASTVTPGAPGGVAGNALSVFTNSAAPIQLVPNGRVVLSVFGGGGVIVNAPTAAVTTFIVNAINGSFAQSIIGGATAGQSFGLSISAGTTAADTAIIVHDATGATTYFKIFGDGGVTVGNPTGGSKGPGTINVANGLYLNGVLYTSP